MGDGSSHTGEESSGRLLIPSLSISSLAIYTPDIITGLLLIDIGLSFGCSVGVAGQIRTSSSIVSVISALLMGVLSIKFRHKSLLMTGLVFVSVSALACFFSPDFTTMLLAYSMTGIGYAMVTPMCNALIGKHLPIEKRGSAIGWIIVGMALSYVIGAPVISFIGDWRFAFMSFVLPLALLSLLLIARGLPSTSSKPSTTSTGDYLQGFREVFSNKSAIASIIGYVLCAAAFQVIQLYSISFYRQRFLLSTEVASVVIIVGALFYISGSLIGGRFVNRFGRKTLTVLAALLLGVFTISYINVANLWLSLALLCLGGLSGGMRFTAANSLALEQVPRFRGTMMSISSAGVFMGQALGIGLGGFVLLSYDWGFMGIAIGSMGIVAALVLHLFAIDPTRT